MRAPAQALVAAMIVCVIFMGLVWSEWETVSRRRTEIAGLEREKAGLDGEIRQLREQRAADEKALQTARELAGGTAASSPLESRLRAVLQRISTLRERMAHSPGQRIPEIDLLSDDDWFGVAQGCNHLETEDDFRYALAELRTRAMARFTPRLQQALNAFLKDSQGQLPTDVSQLAPFFEVPVDSAAFDRYEMLKTGNATAATTNVIGEKTSAVVDPDFDSMFKLGPQTSSNGPAFDPKPERDAVRAYQAANPGQDWPTLEQLTPYFQNSADAARYLRIEQAQDRQKEP
jgi:hypothetical protein